jgi:hypothetical protein
MVVDHLAIRQATKAKKAMQIKLLMLLRNRLSFSGNRLTTTSTEVWPRLIWV